MSGSGKFTEQITAMAKKGRQTAGWLLRVFETRERKAMLILFKALVIPLVEYCCQLWSPGTIGLIRKLENVQRSFTHKIVGMRDLTYWERLRVLDLYSLERRRDRYFIVYIWKIVNKLVPNIEDSNEGITVFNNVRRGKLCAIPPVNYNAPMYIQTIKENSFMIHGPRLFNAIPKDLREYTGEPEGFKSKLDTFLATVPDKPALPHYAQSATGNSLLAQLAHQRAERN